MELAIRSLRKKLHISQTELANRIGASLRAVGSWERGETVPSAQQIWDCAVALQCTPNDVLGWEYEPSLNADERELLDCYRVGTPQWKRNISMTARAAAVESKTRAEPDNAAAM